MWLYSRWIFISIKCACTAVNNAAAYPRRRSPGSVSNPVSKNPSRQGSSRSILTQRPSTIQRQHNAPGTRINSQLKYRLCSKSSRSKSGRSFTQSTTLSTAPPPVHIYSRCYHRLWKKSSFAPIFPQKVHSFDRRLTKYGFHNCGIQRICRRLFTHSTGFSTGFRQSFPLSKFVTIIEYIGFPNFL